MAVEYTPSQRAAIESRGCSLVVSAAAGSGKTAVLVERVIGLICDPHEPVDIDRLLVVTFTEAAASEMREKISSALLRRIASEPGNFRLRRQLSLLPGARIQTVHAFCLSLVREHFALCGVPADFAVADAAEAGELRKQALEDVLEELYAEGSADFLALCSALAEEKGDKLLASVIEDIYDNLTSHPDPERSLERFTSPEGQEGWRDYLLSSASELIDNAANRLAAAEKYMEKCQAVYEKYSPAFNACLSFAEEAKQAIERGWDDAYNTFHGFENARLGAVKGAEYKELADRMKEAKKAFSDAVKYINDKLIVMSEEDAAFGADLNLAALRGLKLAVSRYSDRYSELKLSRKLLDFSDLEHYALKLLRDSDGSPTPLGIEVSEGIDEVLVDEYQDTNDIQEAIFRVASLRSKSSFFVGDVKQSIYRFRMAKPEIFMDRYLSYQPFEEEARGKNMRLTLNRNFRSRREILEACNHVFSAVMSREFGDIDYTEDEALHYGSSAYQGESKVHFEIIDMQGASDDADSPEKAEAEAVYVAGKIAEMVKTETVTQPDGSVRPARYGDFAILLSSFANKSGYFIRELERLDIPVNGGKKDFWNSMEILVMVSFLRVLDNRRQDVPLIGLIRSPFFLFTADELAEIRLEDRKACFFDALRLHAERGDEKSQNFLEKIERYVSYVPDTSSSDMIAMIYSDLSARAVFGTMDRGEERAKNLEAFYNMALDYESRGHRSLFDFIRHIENMMEQGQAPDAEEGEGVRIMSIHKSKGLEFPFVFLPDLNKTFNLDDAKSPVIIHDRMGIGMKIRVRETRGEYRMPMHRAIADAVRQELTGEEVRKLYVAMTRAREKLILVAGIRNAGKLMSQISDEVSIGGISPVWLSQKSNAAAWILAALAEKPCPYITQSVTPYSAIERKQKVKKAAAESAAEVSGELMEMLNRGEEPYKYAHLSALPSKLTPAGARRLLEDSGVIDSENGRSYVDIYPRRPVKNGGLTALERGTAVHLFLQKCDLTRCRSRGEIDAQIAEMVKNGVMTEEEGQSIDPAGVMSFASSSWGDMAQKGAKVMREYEFSALMTPKELGLGREDDENILMNGVIDLMLFSDDGITVVDFKSDNIAPGTEDIAAKRHRLQLEIYALAAEKIFGLPVREKVVFFLRTGCGSVI